MRREASTSSEWSDAENPHTSSLCSDMASTKILPINSAEPQAAPPQTPRYPHITAKSYSTGPSTCIAKLSTPQSAFSHPRHLDWQG